MGKPRRRGWPRWAEPLVVELGPGARGVLGGRCWLPPAVGERCGNRLLSLVRSPAESHFPAAVEAGGRHRGLHLDPGSSSWSLLRTEI